MPRIENHILLRAARGEQTERTPIWLMRQAGRTDPEYVRIKAESGMSLEQLFRHPELAARISLLPRRFGVDAIIYFQDILTPLSPMGAEFVFSPGPVLTRPISGPQDLARLHRYDVADALPFIPETFRLVRADLNGSLPVLGFAGAPLTLAVFILEGGSFGAGLERTKAILAQEPAIIHRLLERLTELTIDFLRLQIAAGADAVQLFESAANLFSLDEYISYALPYQQRIFEALSGTVPTIMFARGWGDLDSLHASGADVLSLSEAIPIAVARRRLGDALIVQGNLDNRLLVSGSKDEIAEAACACIEQGGRRGHIFNLSHGLLRETPFENLLHLIHVVKNTRPDN
ncbi:MAG: uroporphyrinogen decarboxylase [Candidatus Hydrogenedentota bacterium]